MKKIKLTQGKFAIVDDEDFGEVNQYKWFKAGRYAIAHVYKNDKRTTLYMHRLIMNTSSHLDHINNDGLDNQKANLRIATRQQNAMNQHRVSLTTGYKGVYLKKGRYYAGLGFKDKGIHLGIYKTAEEAARAYNEGAKKYFGEFAYLNQI